MIIMPDQVIPQHIAIICDGNRRWAKNNGLAPFMGHKKAIENVFEPLADAAQKRGVKYLTFWIFSTENWKRDKTEIEWLMNLFRQFFDQQLERFHQKNIRVKVIGNLMMLPQDIQDRIKKGEKLTKDNTGVTITLAMSYGGRDEILRAIRRVIPDLIRDLGSKGKSVDQILNPSNSAGRQFQDDSFVFTKEIFENYLDTKGIPDPELIVRTSGEQRTSGFLLWQADYSEWYFPEWHFPDFTPEKLDECIDELNSRKRRFGK